MVMEGISINEVVDSVVAGGCYPWECCQNAVVMDSGNV